MLFICCRTFAKFTKRFKGCHCPLRHVGTPLKTTTDCHSSTTKAFDLEFVVTTRWLIIFHKESFIGTTVESYFFFKVIFMHKTQHISCIGYSTLCRDNFSYDTLRILKSETCLSGDKKKSRTG